MPIHELENFIKQNRHLPEFPSEAEVMKKGVSQNKINMLKQ
jgi:hypothetical protein